MASILRWGAGAAVALVLLPGVATKGSAGSGLYGVVKKGPITPVCQVDVPCDAPVRATLVFSHSGHAIARVRSTDQGRYKISLAPGFYDVRAAAKIGMTKLPKPHAVHVRAGHWDKINLFFDTGIR